MDEASQHKVKVRLSYHALEYENGQLCGIDYHNEVYSHEAELDLDKLPAPVSPEEDVYEAYEEAIVEAINELICEHSRNTFKTPEKELVSGVATIIDAPALLQEAYECALSEGKINDRLEL